MPQPPPPQLITIAIVGAGPAGLTLAKLLLNITSTTTSTSTSSTTPPPLPVLDITIYDLDPSPHSRAQQGGTLDLHPNTGLLALRKCGLYDAASPWLRYEGEELRIADSNGWCFVHLTEIPKKKKEQKKAEEGIENGTGKGKKKIWDYEDQRPEIDREKLKEILLEGVGEERVRWGKKVRRVIPASSSSSASNEADKPNNNTNDDQENTDAMGGGGGSKLEFSDGTLSDSYDLIIGADGAFSKVRHVLTSTLPQYSGICGVQGRIPTPKKDYPEVDKMVGRGSYFTYSNEKALMAQRLGDESIKVGMWFKREAEWVKELWERSSTREDGGIDGDKVRRVMLEEFQGWTEELRQWIWACDGREFTKWVLYELPVGHTWEHQRGYTLIGDAAHLCTPFAGLGVNAAMKDALDLSEAISRFLKGEVKSLDKAVKEYEEEMFPRAETVQRRTMQNKESMFRNDSPVGFMAMMMGVIAEEVGVDLDKGWLRWFPVRRMTYASMWLYSKLGGFRRWFRERFWRRRRGVVLE